MPRVTRRGVVQEKEVRRARAVGHRFGRVVRPSQIIAVEFSLLKTENGRALRVSSVGTEHIELRRGRRARSDGSLSRHRIVSVGVGVVECINLAVGRRDGDGIFLDNQPFCILLFLFVGVDVRTNVVGTLIRSEKTFGRLDVVGTVSGIDKLPSRRHAVRRVPTRPRTVAHPSVLSEPAFVIVYPLPSWARTNGVPTERSVVVLLAFPSL